MQTYIIIKSDIGFLCAVVNGQARWSTEYPDAIVYPSLRAARSVLKAMPCSVLLTDAVIIKDYGLDSEHPAMGLTLKRLNPLHPNV